MLFATVFQFFSWQPVHLSMLSWSSYKQYSTQYSFHPTGWFPTYSLSKQQTAVREEWIMLKWLSSMLEENIGGARDQTSDLLFSSPQQYWLSYGAGLIELRTLWSGPNLTLYQTTKFCTCPDTSTHRQQSKHDLKNRKKEKRVTSIFSLFFPQFFQTAFCFETFAEGQGALVVISVFDRIENIAREENGY